MSRVHNVIFVVGAPGAGKTTALRTLALPSDYQTSDTEVRWTLRGDRAFIGHYENKILDGGDRVARHANLLCLEWWKLNILTNPRFSTTILDGEMYLWSRILESFRTPPHSFVKPDEAHYLEGGIYHRTLKDIMENPKRFPLLEKAGEDLPEVRVHCIYLYVSPEVSLQRRRAREASAEAGATINSDRHMQIAASKQRNFAMKFKGEETPFFMETEKSPSCYLEVNVENMSSVEVVGTLEKFIQELSHVK